MITYTCLTCHMLHATMEKLYLITLKNANMPNSKRDTKGKIFEHIRRHQNNEINTGTQTYMN